MTALALALFISFLRYLFVFETVSNIRNFVGPPTLSFPLLLLIFLMDYDCHRIIEDNVFGSFGIGKIFRSILLDINFLQREMSIKRIGPFKRVIAVAMLLVAGISAACLVLGPLSWVSTNSATNFQRQGHIISDIQYDCAGWLQGDHRKVLAVGFQPYTSLSQMDGEHQLVTNMVNSLLKLGFAIDFIDTHSFDNGAGEADPFRYHRIFYLTKFGQRISERCLHSCNMRVLFPASSYSYEHGIDGVEAMFHEKQILTAFPQEFGTHLWDDKASIRDPQVIMHKVGQSFDDSFVTSFGVSRYSDFEDTMCALMEDDSVCSCEQARSGGDGVDCRSSFYMKKQPIFGI